MSPNRLPQNLAEPDPVKYVAIASDSSWAHLYKSMASLLADTTIGTGGTSSGGLEFYDADGRRMLPVFNSGWTLVGLEPDPQQGAAIDPNVLRGRMQSVVAHVKTYVSANFTVLTWPAPAANPYATLDLALAALPDLDAQPTLDKCFALFVERFGGMGAGVQNSGSWWHNVLHASGWKHH